MKLPLIRNLVVAPARAPILRYGVALLSTVLALIPTLFFSDIAESRLVVFAVAVMVSAWYGGWKPGLAATSFALTVSAYYSLTGGQTPTEYRKAIAHLALFFAVALLICWFNAALRATQESLRRSESNFRSLVMNAPYGICRCDALGILQDANPALVAMFGYDSAAELRGRHLGSLYADAQQWFQTADYFYARTEFNNLTTECVRKDGAAIVARISGRSIPNGNDGGSFEIFMEDATETRTLELQLRQAQKMEALGTLAGGTAHEFNNMLGIMLGNCDFAKSELAPNHPVQLELDEILKAGQRAEEIVQQVLAFSRLQNATRTFLELRTPVLEAVQQIRKIVPGSVAIQTDLPADSPPIQGNATQIHQVVVNICLNAWHAMEENRGLIQLTQKAVTLNDADAEIHPALHAGPYLRLTITDDGRGMEKKILDRIFEPFFTTKAPGKGSGLGLAVVHGIMQTHEGAVVARSEPGQGSTFDLYFPAHPEARLNTALVTVTPEVNGNGLHILLVDDEPSLCRIAAKLLHRLGYGTTEVGSATAALDKIREQPEHFNLVITDLTMPEMDGLSLARALHQLRPGLPVILASGFDMQRTGEADGPPNIRARLQKPYTRETLSEQVNDVLNGKKTS